MSFNLRLKLRETEQFADRLARVDGRRLALSAVQVVNEVTTEFNDSQIAEQTRGINLTPAYVRSKTDLALATTAARPRAEILTRGDLTPLGNFTPLRMIAGRGALRRAGPRVGLRNAGTHVTVKRGAAAFEPQWFVLPLRRGRTAGLNGFGVFVRDDRIRPSPRAESREGRAGKRHIYGPSPYSLFQRQIDTRHPEITRNLAERALRRMGDAIEDEVF